MGAKLPSAWEEKFNAGTLFRGKNRPLQFTGPEIRSLRERYSATVADFAALVGVEMSTLESWENGCSVPERFQHWVRLAILRQRSQDGDRLLFDPWSAERIRALRARYNETTTEFAPRLGLSAAELCELEEGECSPARPVCILLNDAEWDLLHEAVAVFPSSTATPWMR